MDESMEVLKKDWRTDRGINLKDGGIFNECRKWDKKERREEGWQSIEKEAKKGVKKEEEEKQKKDRKNKKKMKKEGKRKKEKERRKKKEEKEINLKKVEIRLRCCVVTATQTCHNINIIQLHDNYHTTNDDINVKSYTVE